MLYNLNCVRNFDMNIQRGNPTSVGMPEGKMSGSEHDQNHKADELCTIFLAILWAA